jgi:pimeloyl-ACP methyl ester carboxylesterase
MADKVLPAEVRPRIVDTALGPVEYAICGSGPPILYFHGTGAAGDLVFPLEMPLIRDGYQLIVPNRPGYGETVLAGHESASATADLAAASLDELGYRRVTVMGSSGGGVFATAFAARHPERTECLVLECAQVHRWSEREWLSPANRWTFPWLVRPRLRRWLLRSYRWQLRWNSPRSFLKFEAGPRFAELIDDSLAWELSRLALTSMRRCASKCVGFDNDIAVFLSEDVLLPNSIHVPTLVIHDPHDPIVPLRHAEWAAHSIPHAELCLVATGGHLIWVGSEAAHMHTRRLKFLRQSSAVPS